jgi:hypothetical protein
MDRVTEVIALLTDGNNGFAVPSPLYDAVTGLVVVLTMLAIKYFKFIKPPPGCTEHSMKIARRLFYTGSTLLLVAILVNRLLHYPPAIAWSGFLYVLSYSLIQSTALFFGVAAKKYSVSKGVRYASKTNSPA